MPHVVVKLYPGPSEEQKQQLADDIVAAVMARLNCAEKSLSVSIEEVAAEDWPEQVFRPDILDKPDILYKKPGYNPL